MARVSTYLNSPGHTEAAFRHDAEVFGSTITALTRMGDLPEAHGDASLTPDEAGLVMNVQLPITAGHVLMGTDALASRGHAVTFGSNLTIAVEVDTRDEASRIFAGLAAPAHGGPGMAEMPWGAFWGTCVDSFGVRWMLSSPLGCLRGGQRGAGGVASVRWRPERWPQATRGTNRGRRATSEPRGGQDGRRLPDRGIAPLPPLRRVTFEPRDGAGCRRVLAVAITLAAPDAITFAAPTRSPWPP
jgi:PhnB protein